MVENKKHEPMNALHGVHALHLQEFLLMHVHVSTTFRQERIHVIDVTAVQQRVFSENYLPQFNDLPFSLLFIHLFTYLPNCIQSWAAFVWIFFNLDLRMSARLRLSELQHGLDTCIDLVNVKIAKYDKY
jgi:hypothetical protein